MWRFKRGEWDELNFPSSRTRIGFPVHDEHAGLSWREELEQLGFSSEPQVLVAGIDSSSCRLYVAVRENIIAEFVLDLEIADTVHTVWLADLPSLTMFMQQLSPMLTLRNQVVNEIHTGEFLNRHKRPIPHDQPANPSSISPNFSDIARCFDK